MPKTIEIKGYVGAAVAGVMLSALMAPIGFGILAGAPVAGSAAPVADEARTAAVEPVGLPELHDDLPTLIAETYGEVAPRLHPEQQCLATAVYFEARSEPLEGQLAVAQVVLNRVMDDRYPTSICGVVFQGEHMRHKCQFSFACDGLSDRPRNPQAWAIAKAVSQVALQGYWDDVTATATHYHADYVMPYWGEVLEARVQHGRHIFYRDDSF